MKRRDSIPQWLHVKKGDSVIILSGKDRGMIGIVQNAYPSVGKLTVEGLNMVSRHQKPRRDAGAASQQGVIEKPAPLFSSKVMLQCPNCKKGTRPHRVLQPDGRRARVCRKCSRPID